MAGGTCTIVIPTFNEELNVVEMATCLREMYPDFYISFMDDNSTDRTKELVESLNDPKTRIFVRKPEERGLAASCLQGISEAKTDYFVTIDCDFQHPPSALQDMYDELEKGCDLVIGVRVDRKALGFIRWLGSWGMNIFADTYLFLHGKKTSIDVMSGLYGGRVDVFRPVIVENVKKGNMEMQGWKVLLDLLKFGPSDMKTANIHYEFGKREKGESHLSPLVVITSFHQCGMFGRFCAKIYSLITHYEYPY